MQKSLTKFKYNDYHDMNFNFFLYKTRKFQIWKVFPSKHVFHGNINKTQYYYMGHKSRAAYGMKIFGLLGVLVIP